MVYIASPFFTDDQIKDVSAIESLLESTQTPYFSPRQGSASKRYSELIKNKETESLEFSITKKLVYLENLEHLKEADRLLINLSESSNYDSGTIWELGYFLSTLDTLNPIKIASKITLFKDTEFSKTQLNKLIEVARRLRKKCLPDGALIDETAMGYSESSSKQNARYIYCSDSEGEIMRMRAHASINKVPDLPHIVILAEREENSELYYGASKLMLGCLVGIWDNRCWDYGELAEVAPANLGVAYIDIPRRSNIMLTQSGVTVIEVDSQLLRELHKDVLDRPEGAEERNSRYYLNDYDEHAKNRELEIRINNPKLEWRIFEKIKDASLATKVQPNKVDD